MYKAIRAIFFLFDPEKVHYFSMNALRLICRIPLFKTGIANHFNTKTQTPVNLFNLSFANRVGLGAGFDKNAKYLPELKALGFGHIEIGTVTPLPQDGNEKPRLFRLPKDKALINRMGFNNDGVEIIAKRLSAWRSSPGNATQDANFIIGGNIGKNKSTSNEDAWKDYEKCFLALYPFVDYFVVNVSSPNTPGLRELQEKESLRKIFNVLQLINSRMNHQRPVLLKIAPDLTIQQVDDVIDLAIEIQLDGLIVSNTTINRDHLLTSTGEIKSFGAGGLSGMPLKQRSTELIRYIHSKSKGKINIIGCGGIFNGADAKEKMEAGASLVQVWTGFVYEGPSIVKNITTYLAAEKSS